MSLTTREKHHLIPCYYLIIILVSNIIIFPTIIITPVKAIKCDDRYTVYVVNKLPQTATHPLEAHCASGDDDLGYRKLRQFDEEFHWSFCDNFWGTTLYFCHFWWFNKDRSFDAYNAKWRDGDAICDPTGICYYEAREDGIYFANAYRPKLNMTKLFNWNVHDHV